MIERLLDRLDSTTKSELLGKNVITELKGILDPDNSGVIDTRLLDKIIVETFLPECRKHLHQFIDVMNSRELESFGFKDYDKALDALKKDKQLLCEVWDVEHDKLYPKSEELLPDKLLSVPKYGDSIKSNGAPHAYQLRLKHEILSSFNGICWSALVSMPTGAGKTRLANEILVDLFRNKKTYRVLWLVDSKELLNQSLNSFDQLWREKGDSAVSLQRMFGTYKGLDPTAEKVIVYAGFDLITSRKDNVEIENLLKNSDLVIIDEAHVSGANTYSAVIENYKDLNDKYIVLGLTATPYRSTGSLKNDFGSVLTLKDSSDEVIRSPIDYLISLGYLSSLKFEILQIEVSPSDQGYLKAIYEQTLTSMLNLQSVNKRCVIFAQSRAQAVALNEYLIMNDVKSGLIIGSVKDSKREKLIEKMKVNALTVLVNHNILSTGLDIPGLESIMILANISSPTLALQTLGRAMRGIKNGGNESNTVFLTPNNYRNLENFDLLEQITLNT